jgi:hypothetical protein
VIKPMQIRRRIMAFLRRLALAWMVAALRALNTQLSSVDREGALTPTKPMNEGATAKKRRRKAESWTTRTCAMRLALRIVGAMLLVVCSQASADQLYDEGGIQDSGIHVGRAMWAVSNCNIRSTDQLELMRKLGLRAHAQSFERGLEVGATEALKVEKNSSRKEGCTIAYIMYGKNGMIAAGLLEWMGPVHAR